MHIVVETVLKRAKCKSKPLNREDSYKIGLVIEGGGMRGVVSAGMVTALQYLGLTNSFDAVYGTSAGAINGAYFISNQTAWGTSIYYEDINNSNFIKGAFGILVGLLTNKKSMNLHFLLDVMANRKKLDWQKVVNSPIILNVIASSLCQQKKTTFNEFKSRQDLFESLRASASIPLIAGTPVEIENEYFLDGSLFESIPLQTAIDDKCTHILVLRTRPDGVLKKTPSFLEKYYLANKIDSLRKGYKERFLNNAAEYAMTVRKIEQAEHEPKEMPYIYSIKLPNKCKSIKQNEKNRNKLVQGAKDGLMTTALAFQNESPSVCEVLCPFSTAGYPIEY